MGNFQFFTYIQNEDLNFKFYVQDLNKNKDSDDININLYYQNKLISTAKLDDDGNSSDNGVISNERVVQMNASDLPIGVYKIEMRVNDDIVINSIKTSQQKISFLDKIRLTKKSKLKNIYTNTNQINIKVINPASLQKVKFEDSNIDVNETYKQFSLKIDSDKVIKEIILDKNDIIIGGRGMFSFNKNSFLNPRVNKVDKNLDVEKRKIDYVLTKYNPHINDIEWIKSDTHFELNLAYSENNKYKFIISIPDLKAEDGGDDFLVIKEIKAIFSD